MEISRLIFSKETRKKMNEELSRAQRGKLRWNRIKDADDNGILSHAKNRYEVANIAGYSSAERSKGYQWVSNLVRRGHLQEIMHGLNNGKFEYEYHVAGEPDFSLKNARKAAKQKLEKRSRIKTNKKTKHNNKSANKNIQDKAVAHKETKKIEIEENNMENNSIKIKMSDGRINIEVEVNDCDKAIKLIATILKGE